MRPLRKVSQQTPTLMAPFYILNIHYCYFNAGIWRQGCILIKDERIAILEQSKKHHLTIFPLCHFALASSGGEMEIGGCKRSLSEVSLYFHSGCCMWRKYGRQESSSPNIYWVLVYTRLHGRHTQIIW